MVAAGLTVVEPDLRSLLAPDFEAPVIHANRPLGAVKADAVVHTFANTVTYGGRWRGWAQLTVNDTRGCRASAGSLL
jgi:hypothetical protein